MTGIDQLTRIYPKWPPMTPWTALWLAALVAAILVQSGHPSRGRAWAGRGLAAAVGVIAVMVLAEYAGAQLLGLDQLWFGPAVRMRQSSWPGRPSPQTASSVLLLAVAVALIRVDRWTRVAWPACLVGGAAIPFVTLGAYLFNAYGASGRYAFNRPGAPDGLGAAAARRRDVAGRPDRFPLAWLLARPDRGSLVRLAGILAGFPIVVALSRPTFLALGLGEQAEWTFSILFGALVVGAVTFYFSQREQKLLIEKQLVSKERADAETRYHLLADNAVDIIVHLRGGEVAWVSPSVEAALGGPLQRGLAQISAAASIPRTSTR